jgi:predicted PolB exonuclease-like 3'-5' exonuclease
MSFDMYFDIETGPSADAELFKPEFQANRAFKDPVKIAEDLEKKAQEWSDKLALSALTGQILAIGWCIDDRPFEYVCVGDGLTEADVIEKFFETAISVEKLVGFNSHSFDLPFIYRRSLRYSHIMIPHDTIYPRNRRLSSIHTDLMEDWSMYDTQARVSLSNLAKFFGLRPKTGNGKDFDNLFRTNKEEAIAYLKHDVELTREIANRMGY